MPHGARFLRTKTLRDVLDYAKKSRPLAGQSVVSVSTTVEPLTRLRASCQDFAGIPASDQGDEAPPPGPPTLFSVPAAFPPCFSAWWRRPQFRVDWCC